MRSTICATVTLLAVLAWTGCDDGTLMEPSPGPDTRVLASHQPADATCEVISFDDQGFEHGDEVNRLETGFGFTIDVNTTGDGAHSDDQAVVYDTDNTGGPDFDLEWDGENARCPDCRGQGNILIIRDSRGFEAEGDSDTGGDITLTGFEGHGTFHIGEFEAFDHEAESENEIRLYVDEQQIGASSGLGDGSVETVKTETTEFTTSARFRFDGSGAVDDLEICRVQEEEEVTGDEGCTMGFWKNNPGRWPEGVDPADSFDEHFDSEGLEITYGDDALMDILEMAPRGDLTIQLARQAIAAYLNAVSEDVEFALTSEQVVALFHDGFNDDGSPKSDGEISEIIDELAELNEQECPLDADEASGGGNAQGNGKGSRP